MINSDQPKVVAAIEKFKTITLSLPDEDAQPLYQKTDTLPYNISRAKLGKLAERASQRTSNMLPLASKEDFLKITMEE